ncbi:unnamed protein product [Peronospora belbahrii]|uniref:Survival motor neuron Tudor domain-containing protein n=1 Tax=Peronospora belbahrii TaxID=622444 RepID=A0AAU9L8L4_9STRA|nr:unnamed protein product [Peronospora belbahrii]
MTSKSGSEQDSEEQWDDMAIVRAFEDALREQHSHSSSSGNKTDSVRKQRAVTSQSNGNNTTIPAAIDAENKVLPKGYEHPTAREGTYRQPSVGAHTDHAAGANPFAFRQQQQQYHQSDLYQAAYAQAYAQLRGQFDAVYSAPSLQQPYGTSMQMPVQSPYCPPPPPIPSIPTPFPGMPAAQGPGMSPNVAVPDDGLANVLMAWYQSGYYTGRFQAMQEMKLRGHR